jgi:hypothetical protein
VDSPCKVREILFQKLKAKELKGHDSNDRALVGSHRFQYK